MRCRRQENGKRVERRQTSSTVLERTHGLTSLGDSHRRADERFASPSRVWLKRTAMATASGRQSAAVRVSARVRQSRQGLRRQVRKLTCKCERLCVHLSCCAPSQYARQQANDKSDTLFYLERLGIGPLLSSSHTHTLPMCAPCVE